MYDEINKMFLKTNSHSHFKHSIIDLIAGSVGGVTAVLVGQPLDTVKVKMQTFPSVYTGMRDCFVKTYRTEGVFKGLYVGTRPAIIASVAEYSVLFLGYGMCQKVVGTIIQSGDISQLSILSNATAGSFASLFSAFIICPIELIKVRLQCAREMSSLSKSKNEDAFKIIRKIVKEKGVLGLFQGLQSTILREMPGYFVYFGVYEGTRTLITPTGKTKNEFGPGVTVVSGAISGIAFWSVIYPIDVVKSRIQVSKESSNGQLWRCICSISRHEGILVLFSGLKPTLIKSIPASAALFLSYEWTKEILYNVWT